MMNFQTFHLTAMQESSAPLEIHPTWDFSEAVDALRKDARTVGGQLNSYKLTGESYQYTIPLTYVDSATRNDFTRWWRNQNEVVFTTNLSSSPESVVCRITNITEPLGQRSEMQPALFDGVLMLQSVRSLVAAPGAISAFTLDDPVFGLLDSNNAFLTDDLQTQRAQTLGKGQGGPFILDNGIWGAVNRTYNILL